MKNLFALALLAVTGSSFAFTFGGTGGNIPDNNVTGITSTSGAVGPVTSITSVTVFGLFHSWSGDVTLTLTNAAGVSRTLVQRVGRFGTTGFGDSSNFGSTGATGAPGGTYVFQDGGANILTAATAGTLGTDAIAPGTYEASSNLFTGANAAASYAAVNLQDLATATSGTWTLTAVDGAADDLGGFTSWEVNAVPEPATMAVLGLGLAAAARRRRK